QLHRRVPKQQRQASVPSNGPAMAECVQIVLVLVISANEIQIGMVGKRLAVKVSDVAATDNRNIHAASRARLRDPDSEQCLSIFIIAAAMSSMSSALPRKTS